MWLLSRFSPSMDRSVRWYEFECDGTALENGGMGSSDGSGAIQGGITPGADHWMPLGHGFDYKPTPDATARCRMRAVATHTNIGGPDDAAFYSEWSPWVDALD
ncbi:unannotated protein [freshwater metagenome]|uniref:Unannotated protein n=1 Tax=freshwater metagenome TaxID=449393 RepID=A0A6J6HSU4_9ZZZZ